MFNFIKISPGLKTVGKRHFMASPWLFDVWSGWNLSIWG